MSNFCDTLRQRFLKQSGSLVSATGLALANPAKSLSDTRPQPGFSAGGAQRDVTPPVGMEILHFYRNNVGVYDPLFVRALVIADATGKSVALVTGDFLGAGFVCCDEIRARVREKTDVDEVWFSASHTHSGRWLVSTPTPGRSYTDELEWDELTEKGPIVERPEELQWNNSVHQAIDEIAAEAQRNMVPVDLRAGRAAAQVGFNRRLAAADGSIYMGINRDGPVVPWVNVLSAHACDTGKPIAIYFEHAAHPVTVPHGSNLVSADFPGAAVRRIREHLGDDVIVLFGQGCSGDINSFPLRSTHADADAAGRKLGEAVLQAMEQSDVLKSTKLKLKTVVTELPTRPLPPLELVESLIRDNQGDARRLKQLGKIKTVLLRGGTPPSRRFEVHGVMIGEEWCLVGLNYELFAQIELWVEKVAPFRWTMVNSLTNGGRAYLGDDEALALGPKGGYEAGSLPSWSGHETMSPSLGPPAVGCEAIVKKAIVELWS